MYEIYTIDDDGVRALRGLRRTLAELAPETEESEGSTSSIYVKTLEAVISNAAQTLEHTLAGLVPAGKRSESS